MAEVSSSKSEILQTFSISRMLKPCLRASWLKSYVLFNLDALQFFLKSLGDVEFPPSVKGSLLSVY